VLFYERHILRAVVCCEAFTEIVWISQGQQGVFAKGQGAIEFKIKIRKGMLWS